MMKHPAWRWAVPAALLVAVVGGGAALPMLSSAAPTLPARTAAQLLVDLQNARPAGLSGTVVTKADLGLPELPRAGESAELESLATGTHTLRVWYSGPDKARLALLGTLGESDIIRNGTDEWTWNSRRNTATHRKITDKSPLFDPSELPKDPKQAADAALKAIDPSTVVTTSGTAKVAGRSAYELTLAPRDAGALIGQVRLAIDADKKLPLRVQVFPRAAEKPAVEVAFTYISFARPGDEQFRFAPPPGARVVEGDKPHGGTPPAASQQPSKPSGAASGAATIGTGWTAVGVRLADAKPSAGDRAKPDSAKGSEPRREQGGDPFLNALPRVSGSWGSGRLLKSKLFSALITDDGRILYGSVAPEKLYAAAADPKASAAALRTGR